MEVGTRVAALCAALALLLQVAAGQILGLYAGDLCRMRCGGAGLCRNVLLCPEATEMVRQGMAPVMCSYNDSIPIVCCPSARKANRMCSVYSSSVYQYEDVKDPSHSKKYDQCVMKDVPFIVGGSPASAHEFPHMALLGYGRDRLDPRWDCGGSLISDHFVMTAAHCILTNRGAPKWARLGELDLTKSDESKHEDFDVVEAVAHPDYKDGVHYNDIGLLRLDRQVTFTSAIRPACLHTLPEIGDKLGIASGWGFLDWADTVNSDTLQKLNLHLYKTEICNFAYRTQATTFRLKNGITEDTMVCAGSPEGGKDTCKGDSGGPLQVKLKSPYCMYSLIGITSFGKRECGSTTSPSVYTRVSHFVPWIEEVVWPESEYPEQTDHTMPPTHEQKPDVRVHRDNPDEKQPEQTENPVQKQPEHEDHPEHKEHPAPKQPKQEEHPAPKQPKQEEHPVNQHSDGKDTLGQQELQEILKIVDKHAGSIQQTPPTPQWPKPLSVQEYQPAHHQQPPVPQPTWSLQGPYHVQPSYLGQSVYHPHQGHHGHQGYHKHQGYDGQHVYQGHHGYHGYHEPYHRQPYRWQGYQYPTPLERQGYFY